MEILKKTLTQIEMANRQRMEEKEKKLDSLLKTPKGLGIIEDLAIKLEGMQQNYQPKKKMVLVMAADNGVEREKVSKSKRVITQYVVEAMLNGTSSINSLAKSFGADVKVVDLGIDESSSNSKKFDFKGIIDKKLMPFGTNNIADEAAMSYETAVSAIEIGIKMVDEFVKKGYNLFATGEMGIGNTTTSSAILKVFTDLSLDDIVGYGSGIDDKTLEHKKNVVKKTIQVNGLLDFFEKSKNTEEKKNVKKDKKNTDFESKINFENFKTEEYQKSIINVLAKVGGLDIAGMAGTYLGGAKNRVPVVIDGFISAVSALIAYKICPVSREFMIASHLSEEPGMKYIMKELNLEPMLFMNMKLGEGTGAVMMFPVIEGACNITKVVREYPDV